MPIAISSARHVRHGGRRARLVALLLAGVPAGTLAQTPVLPLRDALARADALAYGNRVARGTADEAAARTWAALPGVLPALRVEAGLTRTTDPIAAFGIDLRQRSVTPADFEPQRLNYPNVAQNIGAGLVIEQPLFNADAWMGRRAASLGAGAARQASDWARLSTRVDVIAAYYGAVLAQHQVTTLRAAHTAAQEHARVAASMVENGMATPSDALLAAVRAGEVETQLLEAAGNAVTARVALATAMGNPDDTSFTLPAAFPATVEIRSLGERALLATPGTRADVEAARLGARASSADLARARSLYLPRLNSFARYDYNTRSQPFGGAPAWTVGVMASWSFFSGGHEESERRAATARATVAEAQHEAATAAADLDDVRTTTTLRTALARLRIAEDAVTQSADAHRIVRRKYAGGLATVVELLDAAATETRSRLSAAQARYALIAATADRLRAAGSDPAAIAVLDSHNANSSDAPPHD
jgi:outer membrane protein TolC